MMMQKGKDHSTVCEDDINELKQDISAFRCEMIDILQQTGFKVNSYCNAGKIIPFFNLHNVFLIETDHLWVYCDFKILHIDDTSTHILILSVTMFIFKKSIQF